MAVWHVFLENLVSWFIQKHLVSLCFWLQILNNGLSRIGQVVSAYGGGLFPTTLEGGP